MSTCAWPSRTPAGRPRSAHRACRCARANRSKHRLGEPTRRRGPAFSARAASKLTILPSLPAISTGRRSSSLGAQGRAFRVFWRTTNTARRRARSSTTRRRCCSRSSPRNGSTANGVVGFWPANSRRRRHRGLCRRDARDAELATLHTLRQQMARDGTRANLALADFVAPKDTGLADYIGGFAVTAGIGEEDVARRFKRANDDYSKILVKALADRLAEAFAEALHGRVRRELWALCAGGDAHQRAADRRRAMRASGRHRVIRPSPTTPRSALCSLYSMPRRRSG